MSQPIRRLSPATLDPQNHRALGTKAATCRVQFTRIGNEASEYERHPPPSANFGVTAGPVEPGTRRACPTDGPEAETLAYLGKFDLRGVIEVDAGNHNNRFVCHGGGAELGQRAVKVDHDGGYGLHAASPPSGNSGSYGPGHSCGPQTWRHHSPHLVHRHAPAGGRFTPPPRVSGE